MVGPLPEAATREANLKENGASLEGVFKMCHWLYNTVDGANLVCPLVLKLFQSLMLIILHFQGTKVGRPIRSRSTVGMDSKKSLSHTLNCPVTVTKRPTHVSVFQSQLVTRPQILKFFYTVYL